jgi:hypothetical protein
METVPQAEKNLAEVNSDEVITSPLIPDLVIRPISEELQRQALEGIPELRALREEILASRGGRPIPLEGLMGALPESRATLEKEKEGPWISLEQIVNALHEARAAHERGE